jgi:hypothetical protein
MMSQETLLLVHRIVGYPVVFGSGVLPKPLHYRRHQRYVLASYFYVLTVVSLVHLKGELPREVKWLWSPAIGGICIWMLAQRARWTGAVVTAVVVLSALFGGYVSYDIMAGQMISAQNERPGNSRMGERTPQNASAMDR